MVAVVPFLLLAQAASGSDYAALENAYSALRSRDYQVAIAGFETALRAQPRKPSLHKDLAYALLKIGENEDAREHFHLAMELDAADTQSALEYAFLSYESRIDPLEAKAEARRIFNRIRKSGDAVAEQAFQNIDRPLAAGIARWSAALDAAPATFSAQYELAQLAEQRDLLDLAAVHYLAAWRLLPARRSVLVELGRVLKKSSRLEETTAALLAASRGGEPRAAESAREMLPDRYPFVYEFRNALALDPSNAVLHRELAYLLLRMGEEAEAEEEFRSIVKTDPADLLSAAQLGFQYLARGNRVQALPLLERVLEGNDRELTNRVRVALNVPRELHGSERVLDADPRVMGERSFQSGYLKDALYYFQLAREADPQDSHVALKLGWTYNMLHDDRSALSWFDVARASQDPAVSKEADHAYRALRPEFSRFQTTVWLFPFYSSRWSSGFAYGQAKVEWKQTRIRPYVSLRLVGDSGPAPKELSEKSLIAAAGLSTRAFGITTWFEAGKAISYAKGDVRPDYRGGLSWAQGWGKPLQLQAPGWFGETNADEVFISRFGNDLLTYSQTKFGYTRSPIQWFWTANITADVRRQYWANFAETGPGVRFHAPSLPPSLLFSISYLRGVYLINQGNPHRPNFFDLRAGFWYALTR